MLSLHLSSFVKFLIGILFLQGSTGLLVYTALRTDLTQTWPLFAALGITLAAMGALWFNAIADNGRKESLAKATASFSREREKLRVQAEQDKVREVRNSQRQAERQQQRDRLGSQLKTGLLIAGGAGAGLLLLMTQMISLGMLALTTAGGAAIGYGVRARQERLGSSNDTLPKLGRRAKPVQFMDKPAPEPRVIEAGPRRRASAAIPPSPPAEGRWETD